MANIADAVRLAPANARTVQEYIDEVPVWPDGTSVKSTPMTGMQWRIWSLAAAGKFFEGYVVFMTGVALPLIVRDFHIAAFEKGIIGAASLAGILFGAVLLGGLSDYFGRKRMFIAEMIIFCAFLALLILCQNFLSLAICLCRPRSGAWLRLSDSAYDHFGEHPERQSRQTGARRLWLPGCGRASRHWSGLSRLGMVADAVSLALDVRYRPDPRPRRHDRPFLHRRKR
jgi:hypothetical protein